MLYMKKGVIIFLFLISILLFSPFASAYSFTGRVVDDLRMFFAGDEGKVDIALEVREKEIQKRFKENEQWYELDIAKESFFNEYADERVKVDKYVYDPCYLSVERSKPEKSLVLPC